MARLTGKVALITGAASGMGRSAARLFAAEGARVVATDVVQGPLQSAVDAITASGADAVALELDVSSYDSWTRVVDDVVSKWRTIDILINNAGLHEAKGILATELGDWERIVAVNATGQWLGMKHVVPVMQTAKHGSIVNVSSIGGLVGGVGADAGGAAYSAAKGAVRSLTNHAAQAFAADNIRVNAVFPGPIHTGMTEKAGFTRETLANEVNVPLPPHVGDPIDIAYGMLYLASDEAKFVTGAELVIDGGFVSR